MIGSGKSHVQSIASIAQAQCMDGPQPEAITAFASLGSFGAKASNQERDLHRWLRNLYNIDLEVYYVEMNLQVTWPPTFLV